MLTSVGGFTTAIHIFLARLPAQTFFICCVKFVFVVVEIVFNWTSLESQLVVWPPSGVTRYQLLRTRFEEQLSGVSVRSTDSISVCFGETIEKT